jgi:hypothetical protein
MLARSTADGPYREKFNAPAAATDNANPKGATKNNSRIHVHGVASWERINQIDQTLRWRGPVMEKERRVLLASFVLWQHAKHKPSRSRSAPIVSIFFPSSFQIARTGHEMRITHICNHLGANIPCSENRRLHSDANHTISSFGEQMYLHSSCVTPYVRLQ